MNHDGLRRGVARIRVRLATLDDLDLLVRHRRGMWEAIADLPEDLLDAADPAYRRWARTRMQSGRLVGFIVEDARGPVASGCVWLMPVQPRPHGIGTTSAYVLSMFTEPGHRGKGHATRVVSAAIGWAKARGIGTILLHASRFGEPIYRRFGFERTTEMRLRLTDPALRARRRKGTRAIRKRVR